MLQLHCASLTGLEQPPPQHKLSMNKLANNIYKVLMFGACLSMVSAFGVILLGIAAREFVWDIPGLDAYAGYAIAGALFLALPGTLRHGDHIRVSMVLQKLPPRAKSILEYWCLGAGTFLSAYFAWYAVRMTWISYSFHDVSPAADASPLWIPQILMVLGSLGFVVAFADAFICHLRGRPFFEAQDGEAVRAE
jgi:TRAP-type C4-dicarboxylate transport system permease small subunit